MKYNKIDARSTRAILFNKREVKTNGRRIRQSNGRWAKYVGSDQSTLPSDRFRPVKNRAYTEARNKTPLPQNGYIGADSLLNPISQARRFSLIVFPITYPATERKG